MASSKKSKPSTSGSTAKRELLALEREMRRLRAIVKREDRAPDKAWRESALGRRILQETRQEISDFLSNVSHELRLAQIEATYRVGVNKDGTIDGELRVPYPSWVTNTDKAVDVLNHVEEAMDRVPHAQHISVGFTLNQKANEDGIRATVLQYMKYQGELRLNPNYYDTASGQAISFQAAYTVLFNIYKAHGMLPTGMLVRISWSRDGVLRRQNDHELRSKASGTKRRTARGRRQER